ncbi:Protein EXECUTER 2 [Chlorella vulgaris]
MLHCRPLRAATQPSGARRVVIGSTNSSRSAGGRLGGSVRCSAVPEGSAGGSKRPGSSLEQANATLGKQAAFGSERGNGSGAQHASATLHSSPSSCGSQEQGAAAQQPEPGSWDDWMQYFYAMDDLVAELDTLQTELDESVTREDYRAAAALKAQQDRLIDQDCLGAALLALDKAVAEQRFADAARLRDDSRVGMLGWWVGRGDSDQMGHLLRVTPDFCRYVASAYTPRDITSLLPALQAEPELDSRLQQAAAAMLDASALAAAAEAAAAPLRSDDMGLPVMELFLRPRADGSGFDQQATALYALDSDAGSAAEGGASEEEARSVVASTLADFISADPGSGTPFVNVEKGQSPDGSSFVKIEIGSLPEGGDDEAAVPWSNDSTEDEDDEDIRTIDDLAASVGVGGEVDETAMGAASNEAAAALESSSSSTSSSSSSSSADEQAAGKQAGEEEEDDEADQLQRWQQQAAAAEAEAEVRASGPANSNSGFLSRSLRDEVASMTEALLQSGNGSGFTDADAKEIQAAGAEWSSSGSGQEGEEAPLSLDNAASQLGCILQRAPAELVWEGKDKFWVNVREPPALARARAASEASAAAAAAAQQAEQPELLRPPLRIIYDGKEEQRRRGRGGAPQQSPEANGSGSGASTSGSASSSSSDESDGSRQVEITEESESEDISVLLSQPADAQQQQQDVQQQQQQQQQEMQQSSEEALAQDSAALAEQIEAIRTDLEAGRKPSKDQLNEIARQALRLATAQALGVGGAADTAANRWAVLEGRTTYERLDLSKVVKTDPFSGLYVGTFSSHGPEILQVSRQMEDGREWAVATKLTGDPNVPAGTVSWKALIGRSNRLPVEMYPPEMMVTARYKGQGQVAQTGFTNPKWVDGELLVFANDSPFVRGAQLGFTFDVRANQRYLIVLHRIDLDDLFPEDDEE